MDWNRTAAVLLALVTISPLSAAQAGDRLSTWKYVPAGGPYYTRDTSYALGAYLVMYRENDASAKRDKNVLYASATARQQFSVGGRTLRYYRSQSIRSELKFEYSRYPSFFWGIGNDTPETAREAYTPKSGFIETDLTALTATNLYAGLAVRGRFYHIVDAAPAGLIAHKAVPGTDEKFLLGLGPTLLYDSRDHLFFPLSGALAKLQYLDYTASGSRLFRVFTADIRSYFRVKGENVIATQLEARIGSGEVPFYELAFLGGNVISRGIPKRRYRDRKSVAIQTEYRFPIIHRIAGTAFVSAGMVFDDASDFNINEFHPSYGLGLRYLFDTKSHVTSRLDFGFNETGQMAIYFLVAEAF